MAPLFQDRFPKRQKRASFTLVELLMAMAVLSIMLALLAAMVQLISAAWQAGMARADNFTQTRVVLGLIERDVQAMVLRPDVAAFYDASGNPALAFYTRTPGGSGNNRKVSLVEYAVTSTGNPQLLRYDNGGLAYLAATPPEMQLVPSETNLQTSETTQLTDLPASPLATNSSNTTAVPSGLDQAQVLVNGVVALGVQFLRPDGMVTPNTNATPPVTNGFQYNFSNPTSTNNTPTVIVSIVVLDTAAYKIATTTSAFGKLATDLGNLTPDGKTTYAKYWNNQLTNTVVPDTTLPKSVRTGLRVYERRIAIPLPLTIID